MEEKGSIQGQSKTWSSEGQFKLEWCQGFKDSMQLENRLRILDIERQRKIKDIQKKLDCHKRNVELKITKFNRQRDVQNMHAQDRMNVTMYYNRFQQDKKKRQENIRFNQESLSRSRNQEFWSVKKERQENLKRISDSRVIELEEKVQRRNRVRLMEIQAKQNIVSSWNQKLAGMREGRKKVVGLKLKEHQENLLLMSKMEKREKKILEEIYKADGMEKELESMIAAEEKMEGQELAKLYGKG